MNKFPVFCVMFHTARSKTDNKVESLPICYTRNKKVSCEAESHTKQLDFRTPRRKYFSIMVSPHDAYVSVKRRESHGSWWTVRWEHVHDAVKLARTVAEHPFSYSQSPKR